MKPIFFVTLIFLIFCLCNALGLIFIQNNKVKAGNLAAQSDIYIRSLAMRDDVPEDQILEYKQQAEHALVKGIYLSPSSSALWLAYIIYKKTNVDQSAEKKITPGFRPADQVVQIIKILDPSLSKNLDSRLKSMPQSSLIKQGDQ